MAARRPPAGDFVYKEKESAHEQDVKVSESSPEENDSPKAEDSSDDITEEDLKELEQKPIPYARFKEVNEKGKQMARMLEDTKTKYEEQMKMLANQYEARLAAVSTQKDEDPYEYEDETTKQVRGLTDTISQLQGEIKSLKNNQKRQSVSAELDSLAKKYPNADKLAVQGWNVVLPDASLEELMAKSHDDNTNMVKNQITQIINRKKEKAKNPLPTSTTRIKLKADERPKTFSEATRMARKWFGD